MSDFLRLENRHTGEILRLRRVRDASGEEVLVIEGSLPPHSNGPPLHRHFQQREEGSVKAGTLGAQVAGEKIVVPAGGSAAFPAGVVHAWWNAGEDLLEFNGRAVPAVDLDRFLQGVFAVINARANGRPSIFYLAHVLWRHRRTQAVEIPPVAVQKILFPIVLMIGSILGKYRGHDWPGSPESCTGAPLVEGAVEGKTA
jgi:quercetin dioxygenase-like cupin family protein